MRDDNKQPNANMNRRDFLRRACCAAVGTSAIASTVWDMRMINAASAAAAPTDYKSLVCLFLYGGNDGHNTVVPTDATRYNQYAATRGGLAIPTSMLKPMN